MPTFRILFVALEAALSFCFWTIQSRTKDYKMDSCRPWSLDSFSFMAFAATTPYWKQCLGISTSLQSSLKKWQLGSERKPVYITESISRLSAMQTLRPSVLSIARGRPVTERLPQRSTKPDRTAMTRRSFCMPIQRIEGSLRLYAYDTYSYEPERLP